MLHTLRIIIASLLFAFLFTMTACSQSERDATPGAGSLPPGFHLAVYARVPSARSLSLGSKGTVFVGTRSSRVYAVVDSKQNGVGDRVVTIAEGLNQPNGVAFRDGSLYVAEISRVLRYDDIEERLDDPPAPVVIRDDFPTRTHHGWKFIAFGPDGKLYIPVGAPCNVCEPEDSLFGTLMRMNPDGSGLEIFARGIRNTVGFDWDPETGEVWFTDNGRDWLGDDLPPDELNHASRKGLHFGFPYRHGNGIVDPDLGDLVPDNFEYVHPELELGAHVASLGMRFYTGSMFPAEYRGRIFIAEHGSWNRSTPIGYRVVTVRLEDGHAVEWTPFLTGFLKANGEVTGRPVDVQPLPDGSMLVSDDVGGKLWRVSYDD